MAVIAVVLVAVLAALLGLVVSERSATAQSEPETVGRVTGLTATAEGQPPGTVQLTWNPADDAQVYFVLFVKADDLASGNYAGVQMRAFNETEATIEGLEAGASYHFIARGMRYNISTFKHVWGDAWSSLTTATAAGVASGTPTTPDVSQPMPAEPQTVGVVTGLTAITDGQPPGTVQLTWDAAENAQVYLVLFVKSDDLASGNYAGVQMRVFNETEATIEGLEAGASYHFIARGLRYNISTFEEVWGDDWSDLTTTTLSAEPKIPLSELEHWDWLEENKPSLASQLKGLSWVADGVGYSERAAAEALIAAARWYPETFNALLQMSWVLDDVTEHETTVIRRIRWTATDAPALAEPMLQKPWVQDGITRDEAIVIERLYWTIRVKDEALQQEVIQKAVDILEMPFLDTVESPDALAVWDLEKIEGYDTNDFLSIMSHANVSDGITDQEAKVVSVLSSANRYKPDSLPILLDGLDGTNGVYLEERTIEATHSGEVQLTIIRVHDKDTPNMDRLEHAVRVIDEFMGEPLPTNYVAWYLDDAARSAGKGYHAGTHITSSLVYDIVDGDSKSRTPMQHIAHEVGHYYFRGNTHQWLDEGPAKFFESISERERVGRPVAYFKQSCGPAKTIQEQEQLRNDIKAGLVTAPDGWTQCDYYLGERFFVDLYLAMGDEAFRPGLRSLYLKSQRDDHTDDCEGTDLSLCHVEAAFKAGVSDDVAAKVDEVIDRWYYGTGPTSSVSLAELENGAWLEANKPQLANRIKALPWVADGIEDGDDNDIRTFYDERRTVENLISLARWYPDAFNALLQQSWLRDGVTWDDGAAIHDMLSIAYLSPALVERMLQKPWARDGFTSTPEKRFLEYFGYITYFPDEAFRQQVVEAAFEILEMPFLDSVESADIVALDALSWIKEEQGLAAYLEFMSHPTVNDGITDEEVFIVVLLSDENLSGSLLQKPWVQDGINSVEASAIEHLFGLRRTYELMVKISRMPFLDSVEGTDATALFSLRSFEPAGLQEIMSHPKLSDGITDQEASIVVPLYITYHRNPDLVDTLLDPARTTVENRSIAMPLSGVMDLAIVRTTAGVARSMDLLEHGVLSAEEFMGEPFPANSVVLLFDNSLSGEELFTHIQAGADYDVDDGSYNASLAPELIAHEVAHYYWGGNRPWIDEGAADFMELISENARIGAPIEITTGYACHSDSIAELERSKGNPYELTTCDYYLGMKLFFDLYHGLGREPFRQGFRNLYLKSLQLQEVSVEFRDGPPVDIQHLEAAFKAGASDDVIAKVDEVIDRWYYGVGPTSSVSLAELENGAWLEANDPARANRIKALPWVADGVDDSERETAEVLIAAAAWDADLFDALLQKPWVLDSVLTADEARVISTMGSSGASTLTDAILEKSWVQDKITRDEAAIIENLVWMAGTLWEEGLPDDWPSLVQGAAIEILGMPFLNSVESADAAAVRVLRLIMAFEGGTYFLEIMAHPTLSDGITDDEAKIIGLVNFSLGSLREQIDALLDTNRTVEERTIHLPLSGDVDLAIIRTGPGLEHNMDLLAHSVRSAEEFVDEPIPTQWGKWIGLHFTRIPYAAGVNFGGAYIVVDSTCDGVVYDGHWQCTTENAARIIAHEVAHYYWIGNQGWVDEGAAEFMAVISERARTGATLEPTGQIGNCADSISELLRLEEESSDCWNGTALGQRLFLDLYHDLGRETFRQGFRNFYLKSQTDDPDDGCEGTELGICHLEAAFKAGVSDDIAAKVDAVIDRWYYGIGAGESASLDDLERADRLEPEFANQLKALPWIADGIDYTERDAAQMLIDAANHYPDTFSALLQKPWVTDHDLTAAESSVIYGIRWTARRDEASALAILDMPFLETLEFDDSLAVLALYRLARYSDDGRFKVLMEHPTLESGITDDLTTLVAAAGTIRVADEVERMLNPGYANIEVYTGQTELTPELKISIVRTHSEPRPETMPELVRIAEQLESLMQVPLPKPHLIFVISDWSTSVSSRGISQGKRYDFAYGLREDREDTQRFASEYATDRPMLPSVMIHEIGHDYFGNELKSWLNHTPVKNFEYVYRLDGRDPVDVPETVLNTIHLRSGCEARNIQHLEEMNPPSSDRTNSLCHHYLGYWMGRELLEAVGQDEFMARMRRLYHLKNRMVAEGDDPGIAEIRELFPDQLEIVERYWSGDVGNPEEQY